MSKLARSRLGGITRGATNHATALPPQTHTPPTPPPPPPPPKKNTAHQSRHSIFHAASSPLISRAAIAP
jgi:hypothetical protein